MDGSFLKLAGSISASWGRMGAMRAKFTESFLTSFFDDIMKHFANLWKSYFTENNTPGKVHAGLK